eukprot:1481237-Rhodomonas_salina.4
MAGVLGECKALAHLDVSGNRIGDDGAGRLAGVQGAGSSGLEPQHFWCRGSRNAGECWECKALAHLDLGENDIGDEGVGMLSGVSGDSKALVDAGTAFMQRVQGCWWECSGRGGSAGGSASGVHGADASACQRRQHWRGGRKKARGCDLSRVQLEALNQPFARVTRAGFRRAQADIRHVQTDA